MVAPTVSTAEDDDPFCLAEEDAAALLANAPWRRFGVFGDSLSLGTGDASPGYVDLGWADRLAGILRRVNPDLAYLNTAEIGATTDDVLARQADRILEFRPDLLHVPCGGNDLVRRAPDFDSIEATLRRMYDLASSAGAQLVTFTLGRAYVVPVFSDWSERVRILNHLTRTVAAEYGAVVVDMYDHPVNDRTDLLSADRIHFTTQGQAVMTAEVVKGLAGVLDSR